MVRVDEAGEGSDEQSDYAEDGRRRAPQIWRLFKIDRELRDLDHTRAASYLAGRGLTAWPADQIQYHPKLWHGWTRTVWPAMVAAVRDPANRVVGVHRTWLSVAGDQSQRHRSRRCGRRSAH
jgi:hypothetical protein